MPAVRLVDCLRRAARCFGLLPAVLLPRSPQHDEIVGRGSRARRVACGERRDASGSSPPFFYPAPLSMTRSRVVVVEHKRVACGERRSASGSSPPSFYPAPLSMTRSRVVGVEHERAACGDRRGASGSSPLFFYPPLSMTRSRVAVEHERVACGERRRAFIVDLPHPKDY
jgi:hypothetical protein